MNQKTLDEGFGVFYKAVGFIEDNSVRQKYQSRLLSMMISVS
jgi:hypothetical protein